jgi:type III secretion protein T
VGSWEPFLPMLAVAMLRPLGVLLMMPMLSSRALGGSLCRNALIVVMALPIVPLQLAHAAELSALSGAALVMLGLKEVVIGFLIGFCVAMPFWAIEMAGTVIDTVRGSSMASVLNPLLGEQSSVFGILFSQILVVIFFVSGGFNTMLAALYASYASVPTLAPLALMSSSGASLATFMGQQWQAMLEMSVSFALPSMVVMVLVDVALGLVNRSAQQLNVFFVAMPIKSGMALFVLAISLGYGLSAFTQRFDAFGGIAQSLMETLR